MSTYATEKQERYFFYNSLAILLKAVEGSRTTVELRNEASIHGLVEQADGFMNVLLKDCVFTDPRGDSYSYEVLFVQARNIRYVHIPAHVRIIPAIKEQLGKLHHPPTRGLPKRTVKSKRAEIRQAEGVAMANKIIESKQKNKESES